MTNKPSSQLTRIKRLEKKLAPAQKQPSRIILYAPGEDADTPHIAAQVAELRAAGVSSYIMMPEKWRAREQ